MMRTHINLADLTQNVDELIDAIDVLIRKADDDLEETLEAEGFVEPKTAVRIINELEDDLTDALNGRCDELLDALGDALDINNFTENVWPTIRDETDLRDKIYDIFYERWKAMFENSLKGFLAGDSPELLSDGVELLTDSTEEFIQSWSKRLSEMMHLSTNEQIEGILLDAHKNHLSVDQVAQKIADSGIREPGYKARRVALTETLRAESYAQLTSARMDPKYSTKKWEHTGAYKNKPRENHVAMNGQEVPIDEPFTLKGRDGGTYYPMCPRDIDLPPGESINCHCLMSKIKDPHWDDLTAEEKQAAREQRLAELNGDSYNKSNDPLLDAIGSVEEYAPAEMKKIIAEAESSGVEVIYDSPGISYAPGLKPGIPGQLHVSPEDSYGAWLHERQHMIDDMQDGWGGFQGLFNVERRTEMEYNAYKQEIELANKINRPDIAETLKDMCHKEIDEIGGEWDEKKLK